MCHAEHGNSLGTLITYDHKQVTFHQINRVEMLQYGDPFFN